MIQPALRLRWIGEQHASGVLAMASSPLRTFLASPPTDLIFEKDRFGATPKPGRLGDRSPD
jgi:hypothetical protein